MAVGDKFFAIMDDEKAMANGVATLGSDGILLASQRPSTDSAPTKGSSNPVQSGGVYTALLAKADLTLSNLSTPQQALANLGAGVRPNELDNPYFAGGGTGWGVFPVNQKGGLTYGAGQAFDRWGINGGTLTLSEEGISWTTPNVVSQRFSTLNLADGVRRTFSYVDENNHGFSVILTAGYTRVGDYQVTHAGTSTFYIKSDILSPAKISYMKLEKGENQTLFFENGDGTVTLLPQADMNYSTQLRKCQEEFVSFENLYGYGFSYSSEQAAVCVDLPERMRILPAINVTSFGKLVINDSPFTPSAISVSKFNGTGKSIILTISGNGFPINYPCVLGDVACEFIAQS